MINLGNRPPEKLSKDTIISIAVVLNNIKESAKDEMSGDKTIVAYPVEQKAPYIKGLFVTPDMQLAVERSIIAILEYLRSHGAVEEVVLLNQAKDHDYQIRLKPARFIKFYDRVIALTLPYIDELIKNQTRSEVTIQSFTSNTSLQNEDKSRSTKPRTVESYIEALPPIKREIGSGFTIHMGDVISYDGRQIILEKRLNELAVVIMERSKKGFNTSKEYIAHNVLDENRDYDLPEDYAVKLVSKLRKDFKNLVGREHDYFKFNSPFGYKFTP